MRPPGLRGAWWWRGLARRRVGGVQRRDGRERAVGASGVARAAAGPPGLRPVGLGGQNRRRDRRRAMSETTTDDTTTTKGVGARAILAQYLTPGYEVHFKVLENRLA